MRILLLSSLLVASVYALLPKEKSGVEIDDIKLKVSAPKREDKVLPARKPQRVIAQEEVQEGPSYEVVSETTEDESSGEISATTDADQELVTTVEEVQEPDHEKNWQDELSGVLADLEPEYGEEIYNSYLNEKNSFQSSLDELIRSNQKNQDLEYMIGELEGRHEQRVKEIFGRYYEEIKAREIEFNESQAAP